MDYTLVKKCFTALLLLSSLSLWALTPGEFPQSCDEAYELYRSGDIDTVTYERFVKLLLSPIDPFRDGFSELHLLGGECLFPSDDSLYRFKGDSTSFKKLLLQEFPQLRDYNAYIDWQSSEYTFKGKVRSRLLADSHSAVGHVALLSSFPGSLFLRTGMKITDTAVTLNERSLKREGRLFTIEAGSLRPTILNYYIKPVVYNNVADSLTWRYGNGRYLNGVNGRLRLPAIDLTALLSSLPNERVVLLTGAIHAERIAFLLQTHYIDHETHHSLILGGTAEWAEKKGHSAVLYASETKELHLSISGERVREERWKSITFDYTSCPSVFKAYSFTSSLPVKAGRHLFRLRVGTEYRGALLRYNGSTHLLQSRDLFTVRFYSSFLINSLLEQKYVCIYRGEKEVVSFFDDQFRLKGRWRFPLFQSKGKVGWGCALLFKEKGVVDTQFSLEQTALLRKGLKLHLKYTCTAKRVTENDMRLQLTVRTASELAGNFGVTSVVDLKSPSESQIKLYSTLNF